MADMPPPTSTKGISNARESKVTFSPTQNERRSDSVDQLSKLERRGNKKSNSELVDNNRISSNTVQTNPRVASCNRNFVDSMSGVLGMSANG